MYRICVSSSNLRSVGYDASYSILEIEFKGGEVYQYFRVPASIYSGLMAAGSKGRYFARVIRSRYACTLVA